MTSRAHSFAQTKYENLNAWLAMQCFLALFMAMSGTSDVSATGNAPSAQIKDYKTEVLASELVHPWSMAFLPDNGILISERNGQLRELRNGQLSRPITGLPENIYVAGQGGLQDIVLHPDFKINNWVYLSYAQGSADANQLSVIRAKKNGLELSRIEKILVVKPLKATPVHYGARMLFLPDKTLLVTSGDGFDYREDAQRLNNQLGKVLRINVDGSIPADNPFIDRSGKLSRSVFSLGHRNPQGLVYHHQLDAIYLHEHGPAGGDEINLLEPAGNYGWPIVTNGRDYSGAMITPYKAYPGMIQPVWDWTPSVAPSGMAVYDGDMFAELQGDLLVGTLKDRDVKWIKLKQRTPVSQTSLFAELGVRIRSVNVHKDGSIYLLTDANPGQLIRIYRPE